MAIGLPLGAYWINRAPIRNERAMAMLVKEATVDYFAKTQYRYADRENAREALLFAIQVHKEMAGSYALWGKAEISDLGFCYGELSLLEEASGNADLARNYMAKAEETLREAGFHDPSAVYIRKRLENEPFVEVSLKGNRP